MTQSTSPSGKVVVLTGSSSGIGSSIARHLAESLDHEVRSFGIRAICIEPGFTSTKIDHNSLKTDQPVDDYRAAVARAAMFIGKAVENGMDPEIVARRVREAIEAKYPKLRYPAAASDLLLSRLRRFVPERMFDKSLRKNFRLDVPQ